MSKLNPKNKYNDKYYIHGKMLSGECALFNEKTRNYIKFDFPVDKVPYLGIWVNENGPLLKQYNIAMEPCTGTFDSIDIADRLGQLSQVDAYGTYSWFLRIELGNLVEGWK